MKSASLTFLSLAYSLRHIIDNVDRVLAAMNDHSQVSRLQVAELITAAVLNPDLATNKCLELVAETTAPERPLEDLLESLPTEITKEEQEQLAVIEAEARKELESAQAALAEANEELALSADKVAQLTDALKEAKANEKEVRGEVAGILREGAQAKKELDAAEASAEKAVRASWLCSTSIRKTICKHCATISPPTVCGWLIGVDKCIGQQQLGHRYPAVSGLQEGSHESCCTPAHPQVVRSV